MDDEDDGEPVTEASQRRKRVKEFMESALLLEQYEA